MLGPEEGVTVGDDAPEKATFQKYYTRLSLILANELLNHQLKFLIFSILVTPKLNTPIQVFVQTHSPVHPTGQDSLLVHHRTCCC